MMLITVCIMTLCTICGAQELDTLWTTQIAVSQSHEQSWGIVEVPGSGYVVCGASTETTGAVPYLMAVTETGQQDWIQYYNPAGDAIPYKVVRRSDGSFVMTGTHDQTCFVFCTTASGDSVWWRTYDETDYEYGNWIIESADGGLIVVGATGAPNIDGFVMKLDENGTILWDNRAGGDNWDEFWCVREHNDGGYYCAGFSSSASHDPNGYLMRVGDNGDTLWTRSYLDFPGLQAISDIWLSDQDSLYLAGKTKTEAGDDDFWLLCLDLDGEIDWDVSFGGENDDQCYALVPTAEDGFIMMGHQFNDEFNWDVYMVCVESDGAQRWDQSFGTEHDEKIQHAIRLEDDGYCMVGIFEGESSWDTYLVRTDYEHLSLSPKQYRNLPDTFEIEVSPNPFNPTAMITYELTKPGKISLYVYNIQGEVVATLVDGFRPAGVNSAQFKANRLGSGCYFCVLEAEGRRAAQKMLLVR